MAKAATLKDVLYALEFMGERLCRWQAVGARPSAWSIEPSGVKVTPSIANEALAHGGLVAAPESKHGVVSYVWRQAA